MVKQEGRNQKTMVCVKYTSLERVSYGFLYNTACLWYSICPWKSDKNNAETINSLLNFSDSLFLQLYFEEVEIGFKNLDFQMPVDQIMSIWSWAWHFNSTSLNLYFFKK